MIKKVLIVSTITFIIIGSSIITGQTSIDRDTNNFNDERIFSEQKASEITVKLGRIYGVNRCNNDYVLKATCYDISPQEVYVPPVIGGNITFEVDFYLNAACAQDLMTGDVDISLNGHQIIYDHYSTLHKLDFTYKATHHCYQGDKLGWSLEVDLSDPIAGVDDGNGDFNSVNLPSDPGHLVSNGSTIDFGVIEVGNVGYKHIEVKNMGGKTATGTISFAGNDKNYFQCESSTFMIFQGDTKTVNISFIPDANRTYESTIQFNGTPPCNDLIISLDGIGYQEPKEKCCFPAGTKITLADRTTKNIEDIVIGDQILSYDIEKKMFSSWTVRALGNPPGDTYEINQGLLRLTGEHPLYVQNQNQQQGWGAIKPNKKAVRIKEDLMTINPGDRIFTLDEKWIQVDTIAHHINFIETFNILSWSGTQTYFANDILVFEEHPPIIEMIKWRLNQLYDRFPMLFHLIQLKF